MKKNAGFTMIELLAAVVVLGILMMIAVPTVTDVLNDSKNKTYVDDSIRLISTFDNQMRKDNMMPVPAINCCIAMNLTYLDNNTFNDAPYDGEYDRLYSFVIAKRLTTYEYNYYVRLMEKLPKGGGYRGIDLSILDKGSNNSVVDLYDRNAKDVLIKNKGTSSLFDLSKKTVIEMARDLHNDYGISCYKNGTTNDIDACIIVYAPNREDED